MEDYNNIDFLDGLYIRIKENTASVEEYTKLKDHVINKGVPLEYVTRSMAKFGCSSVEEYCAIRNGKSDRRKDLVDIEGTGYFLGLASALITKYYQSL